MTERNNQRFAWTYRNEKILENQNSLEKMDKTETKPFLDSHFFADEKD